MSFVHLHTHSEYSLLDGANRVSDLVQRAVEFEMPALALTDHGCLFGAWTFQETARKAGVKPIIGMEAYVAPGDRRAKSKIVENARERMGDGGRAPLGDGIGFEKDRSFYHLVLLARDLTGYRNLVKLASIGYVEGFYYKPRIDREVLQQYSEGLIVSSACMAGEVAHHLLAGRMDAAREAASWYANLFDGRYYLEVQAHDSPGQRELNAKVFALAGELGLPVVATNDAHFLRSTDHDAHDVLLCIGLNKDRDDPNRMHYDRGLYFKPPTEIIDFFPNQPQVVTNTLLIADTVDVPLKKQYRVPSFPLPSGATDERRLLHEMTFGKAEARYGEPLPAAIR